MFWLKYYWFWLIFGKFLLALMDNSSIYLIANVNNSDAILCKEKYEGYWRFIKWYFGRAPYVIVTFLSENNEYLLDESMVIMQEIFKSKIN